MAFGLSDVAVGGDHTQTLLAIRFLIGAPLIGSAIALIATPIYFKAPQRVLSLPMLFVGATILAMIAIGDGLIAETYHIGLIFDVVYCSVLARLFFRNACAVVAILCIGYAAVAFTATPLPIHHAVLNTAFLLVLSGLGLAANYLTEAHTRHQYLAARRLRESVRNAQRRKREADEAKAASEARTRLLATMGHEIRNPLTAVIGLASAISDGQLGDTDQQRRLAARIRRNGRHILGILEDVLEFARSEQGALQARPAPIALGTLIDHVRDVVEPLAEDADVDLDTDSVPRDPLIHVDTRLTCQALINLVVNALKFAGTQAEVQMGAQPLPSGGLRLTVTDHGPGMTAAEAAQIFNAFATTDAGRQRGGTGLGLSVVREIARAHGGDVTCNSSPGRGTTMCFDLPAGAVIRTDGTTVASDRTVARPAIQSRVCS
jgi:signal transduction histidine kinase